MNARTPVIVGVGQLRSNRERTVEGAREPLDLLVSAIREAARDAGAPQLLAHVDAVHAVKVASWAYADLAATVGRAIGAAPRTCVDTDLGGHHPVRLLEQAASAIWAGDSDVALVVGAEAQASVSLLGKVGIDPVADLGWSASPGGAPHFDPDQLGSAAMQQAGLVLPTRVYPMYENRLQADLSLTPEEGAAWSAQLYADFSAVAAGQPAAWNQQALSATEVGQVGVDNRIVCEPYPLSMNAMPHVDQAAALIITSLGKARELGLVDLVYVWGGAGADDDPDVLVRRDFSSARALTVTLDRVLAVTGAQPDLVDVYSCFPVVPKLAGIALGLPRDATLSVTGGHSSFGGPLNSYSVHALCAMTDRLRATGGTGLVHANGGHLTYQHALVLSSRPHPDGYVGSPTPQTISYDDSPSVLTVTDEVVVVETATVEHDRAGVPRQAFLVARTVLGARLATSTPLGNVPAASVLSLSSLPLGLTTHVGRRVRVTDGIVTFA